MQKNSTKKFGWQGLMSSSGNLHLDLYLPDSSKEEVMHAASTAIDDGVFKMIKKGYIPPEASLMSSREIAEKYGHSRQYWEKLLREHKIPFYQTAAGRITIDLWVNGYLQNREEVDRYVKYIESMRKRVALLRKDQKTRINGECPQCKNESIRGFINQKEANGLCDDGCGFKFSFSLEDL